MTLVSEIIKLCNAVVKRFLADVHTQMPARVVSYDAATNTCSIQPSIMRIRTDDPNNDGFIILPQIDNVPVKMQGSGKLFLSVCPQVDSYGEYRIQERSIAKWLNNGGSTSPDSLRKFHISDGVFDPGLYPLVADGDNGKIAIPPETDRIALRTRDNTGFIALTDKGDIECACGTAEFNSSVDAAALASKVDKYFTVVDTALSSWTVSPSDGGAALQAAYNLAMSIAYPGPPPGTLPSVESETIKVDK